MEQKYTRFNALIIDPETSTRMRLKQATSSVAEFGKVALAASLGEAINKLNSGEVIDVCFISSTLEQTDIDKFIKNCKVHKNGQDSAYVSVLKGNAQQSHNIAGNVIAGFDGQLFEPYSVDQLIELTRLAARLKKERSAGREIAAISILVKDMVGQIDQLATVKGLGVDSTILARKLKQTREPLDRLGNSSFDNYFSLVIDSFEAAPVPSELFKTKVYAGPSSRIQRRQKEKLAKELESISSDGK